MALKDKIKDWIYRKLIQKQHLRWSFDAQKKGYAHGYEDARLKFAMEEQKMLEKWFVDPDKVFSISKSNNIMLNGKQITDKEFRNLQAEVRAIKTMQVYEILQNTLRQKAVEKGVLQSSDLYSLKGNEQILASKMMIFNLDVEKSIINRIDAYKWK